MKKYVSILYSFMMLLMFLVPCMSFHGVVHALTRHAKMVYVKPFVNDTNKFGLETKFMNAVVDEMLIDGRISLVNTESNADYILNVIIKQYILKPLTYDANMVPEQYKLSIIASVSFVNKDNNVNLWNEPNIEGMLIYIDMIRRQKYITVEYAMTEEGASGLVWSKMSKKIVKQIIKIFNALDKKISV